MNKCTNNCFNHVAEFVMYMLPSYVKILKFVFDCLYLLRKFVLDISYLNKYFIIIMLLNISRYQNFNLCTSKFCRYKVCRFEYI